MYNFLIDSLFLGLQLFPYFVKFLACLCRRLNQIAPLENLRHVKRVQKKHLEDGMHLDLLQTCLSFLPLPLRIIPMMSFWAVFVFFSNACLSFWYTERNNCKKGKELVVKGSYEYYTNFPTSCSYFPL